MFGAIQIPTPQPDGGTLNLAGATIFFVLFVAAALVYLHWTGQRDWRTRHRTH